MKKLFALVLAIAMLFTLVLTGCASKDEPATNQPAADKPVADAPKEDAPQETTPELEQKTIQLWVGGNGPQKDSEMVYAAFNEKLQEYVPNTTVEFSCFPFGEYNEKFTQMLAAGEAVDVAWTGWVVNVKNQIKDGNVLPLDTLVAEYGAGIVDVLGDNVLEASKSADGSLYYIPSWQGMFGEKRGVLVVDEIAELAGPTWKEDTEAALIRLRKDVPTVANLEAVCQQFEIYLEAAKQAGKLGVGPNFYRLFGWELGRGNNYTLTYGSPVAACAIGVQWEDDSFKVIDLIDSDYAKTIEKYEQKWIAAGYIPKDYESLDAATLHYPVDGQIDEYTYILGGENYYAESAVASFTEKCGMAMDLLTIQEQGYIVPATDTCMAIPYCADEPERGMMVLNAIYSEPELYNILIHGIEGVHYTTNDDGTIVTEYSGADCSGENAYGLQRWVIGSCKNAYINNGSDPNYYLDLEAAEKTARIDPFINFQFDTSEVEDIIASLSALGAEYNTSFALDYNEWIEARKLAGVDELIAEFQRQLDEYIAANNITSWD